MKDNSQKVERAEYLIRGLKYLDDPTHDRKYDGLTYDDLERELKKITNELLEGKEVVESRSAAEKLLLDFIQKKPEVKGVQSTNVGRIVHLIEKDITLNNEQRTNLKNTLTEVERASGGRITNDEIRNALEKVHVTQTETTKVLQVISPPEEPSMEIYRAPGQSEPISSPQPSQPTPLPSIGGVPFAGDLTSKVTNKVLSKGLEKVGAAKLVSGLTAKAAALGGPAGWIISIGVQIIQKYGPEVVSWIKRNWKKVALLAGAILGYLLGGFSGMLLGAAGGFIAGGGLAAGGIAAAGAGIFALFAGIFGAVASAAALPTVVVLTALPIIIIFIIFIINSGAYVTPPTSGYLATLGVIESPYIGITKTASPAGPFENGDPALKKITYTITITAKKGALNNIKFNNSCQVTRLGAQPTCTVPTPPDPPDVISPTQPYTLPPYDMDFSSDSFKDSFVRDTFTVTADVEDQQGTQAAATATIKIGKPPEECPNGWPVDTGDITQGAYTTGSHRIDLAAGFDDPEAIDIALGAGNPIKATHAGTVTALNLEGGYGKHVIIQSTCNGQTFISIYGHMSAVLVQTGTVVASGQTIGRVGSTGRSTGNHVHYEFRNGPYGASTPSRYPNIPPYMWDSGRGVKGEYIPRNVPRGCVGTCGITIP